MSEWVRVCLCMMVYYSESRRRRLQASEEVGLSKSPPLGIQKSTSKVDDKSEIFRKSIIIRLAVFSIFKWPMPLLFSLYFVFSRQFG